MDNFVRLVQTRVWAGNEAILGAMFRVFMALIVTGHDANAPFTNIPEFMQALLGDPFVVAAPVVINYVTLQLLIDTGVYLENTAVFEFICRTLEELLRQDREDPNRPRLARDQQFRGNSDFWNRYYNVSYFYCFVISQFSP